jgi:phosphohistidine phosphatase SixA
MSYFWQTNRSWPGGAMIPLLALMVSATTQAAQPGVCSAGETETTVLIVRHAEKTCRRCDELSEAGHDRAKVLPDAVRKIVGELDVVYHSDTKRNRQTVAHVDPKPHIEYARGTDEGKVVAEILEERCGQNVLMAGHSHSAAMVLPLLGVPPAQIDTDNWFPTTLDSGLREVYLDDFDDLFVVKVCGACDSGRRILIHRNYGATTPGK